MTQLNKIEVKAYNDASGSLYTGHIHMTFEHSLQPAGISCMVGFGEGGGGTGEPGEKSLEEEKRTNTNSSDLSYGVREWNLGPNIGGRRVLSPLRHPCSPGMLWMDERVYMLRQSSIKDYFKSNSNFDVCSL